MRVLHINGVIHSGSTGAIIDSINVCLKKNGVDYAVAYGIGPHTPDGMKFCYRYEQTFYRRMSWITGYRYGFAPFATARLNKIIEKYQPDIVHLHSINGNCVDIYCLLKFLKKEKIATVVTNHAEFFYTGNCTSSFGCEKYISGCKKCSQQKWASDQAYFPRTEKAWEKMREAFAKFSNMTIVSVSEYSKRRSIQSPILSSFRHEIILNGIDTETFKPQFSINIRKEYCLSAKRVAVFVTSGFSADKEHLKGGYWLLELASKFTKNEFQFLVVGSENPGIKSENIIFAGQVRDRSILANIYSQCDIALGFSKAETFGMTCPEALCCGIPFAGFLCGGTESIALKEYSRFVQYGQISEMIDAINELITICANQREQIAASAKKMYSSKVMAEKYYKLYCDIHATQTKKGNLEDEDC